MYVPSSVLSIVGAFRKCENLSTVVLSEGLTSINGTFEKCKNLKTIKLPESLERLGSSTFYGCDSLKSIELPSQLNEIGQYAFWHCPNLKTVVSHIKEPFETELFGPYMPGPIFKDIHPEAILFVPKGTREAYYEKKWDEGFKQVIEMTDTSVDGLRARFPIAVSYSIDGRQSPSHHGVNLLRMSDGTVRKVLVK